MTLKNSVKFETKSGLISNNRSVLSKTQVSISDEHNKLINEITDKGWREFTKNMLLRYIFEMNHNNNLIENSKDSTTKDPKLITQYKRYKEKYNKSKQDYEYAMDKLKRRIPPHLYETKPESIE